jgi:hypothetical protein
MKTVICFVLGAAACACGAAGAAEAKGGDAAAEWAEAERTFVRFVTPVLEEARQRLKDPRIQWAQFTNDLVRKYLPDARVYVRDGAYSGDTKIWIVTRDGKITDLGDGVWTGVGGDQWWAVEKVSAYVKGRKIKVETAEQAVEVAKLVEAIQSSPSFVGMLRLNTKDYTVFDERFLTWMYGSKDDWKYAAAKKGGGWEVKVEYVGPPAAVQKPPVYEMVLDEEKRFVDLRRR